MPHVESHRGLPLSMNIVLYLYCWCVHISVHYILQYRCADQFYIYTVGVYIYVYNTFYSTAVQTSFNLTETERGFSRNDIFFAQSLHYLTQNFFSNICASFAHEAEPLLRNIPHHTQQVLRIFAPNYLRSLRQIKNFTIIFVICSQKQQNCAKSNILYKK